MIKNLILILIIIALTSCSASLIYSPSANLSNKPLKEKEVDFQGGIEMLPETRPEVLQGNQTTLGLNGQLAYGFSDNFSMGVKAWADLEYRTEKNRTGYSLNLNFHKAINENSRLIILPRFGIAMYYRNVDAFGLGSSFIFQNSINNKLSWYSGLGLIWGFKSLETEPNINGEERLPVGFGLIGHFGITYQFFKNFRINCEIVPIYQLNSFDENSQHLISPSIGVAYTLNKNGN